MLSSTEVGLVCLIPARPSRSSCIRLVSVTGVQDDGGDRFFFDREAETAELLEYLRSKPRGVLLLLGPRDSGKTRLLKEVLLGPARKRLPPIHIDGRECPITSSVDLIFGLHDVAAKWLGCEPVQSELGGAVKDLMESLAMPKVTAASPLVNRPVHTVVLGAGEVKIKPVLGVYKSWIKEARRRKPAEYPVIWIDEVSLRGQGS